MNSTSGWDGILDDGEEIIWQGRPDSLVVWRDLLSFQSFFGLFFTGFSVFWMAMAAAMTSGRSGPDGIMSFFPLFGLPFFLVGSYLVVGRLFWDAYARGRTWYTLTNKRAFIAREIFGNRSLKDYSFADMTMLDLQDDTPGSIIFAEDVHTRHKRRRRSNGTYVRSGTSTQRIPIGFRRIEDARSVYRLIREHRESTADAAD